MTSSVKKTISIDDHYPGHGVLGKSNKKTNRSSLESNWNPNDNGNNKEEDDYNVCNKFFTTGILTDPITGIFYDALNKDCILSTLTILLHYVDKSLPSLQLIKNSRVNLEREEIVVIDKAKDKCLQEICNRAHATLSATHDMTTKIKTLSLLVACTMVRT
jgi:hypothetical protein